MGEKEEYVVELISPQAYITSRSLITQNGEKDTEETRCFLYRILSWNIQTFGINNILG